MKKIISFLCDYGRSVYEINNDIIQSSMVEENPNERHVIYYSIMLTKEN